MSPKISVIIPTLNEEQHIAALVTFILRYGGDSLAEVIVVDGNSGDNTRELAAGAGAIVLECGLQSRAAQMNKGAASASGDILYFVHADVRLLSSFATDILEAVARGNDAGCYRYQFDSERLILKINAYFTRFNSIACRGGDQTLFIRRPVFEALGGFNEDFIIMEDYDLLRRIFERHTFRIIPKSIVVSARKYAGNSWLRVQIANLTIFAMYFLRWPPMEMAAQYRRMLRGGGRGIRYKV